MLKARPQKPLPLAGILQLLEHMPHGIPLGSCGGFGGRPNFSRVCAWTLSVILSVSSGFFRMHFRQTPRLFEVRGECSWQIWHFPMVCPCGVFVVVVWLLFVCSVFYRSLFLFLDPKKISTPYSPPPLLNPDLSQC